MLVHILHLHALMGMLLSPVTTTPAALTLAHLCRDAATSLVIRCCLVPVMSKCLSQTPCAEPHCQGAVGRLPPRSSVLPHVHPTILLPAHFLPAPLPQAPPVSSCALLLAVAVQRQLCVLMRAAHFTAQLPPAAGMVLVLLVTSNRLAGPPHPRPRLVRLSPTHGMLHSHLPPAAFQSLCADVEGAPHELHQPVQADIATTIAGRPRALFIPTLIQVLVIAIGMILPAKFIHSSTQACPSLHMVTLPEDAVVETVTLVSTRHAQAVTVLFIAASNAATTSHLPIAPTRVCLGLF